jgi:hypothetical protein
MPSAVFSERLWRFAAPLWIRLMPRSWLKTTTKTRRPLKSGTNG